MIKYSIKQTFRNPLKALLFFVLLFFSVTLLTLGSGLLVIEVKNSHIIEENFSTIATVEQRADNFDVVSRWNAYTKQYKFKNTASFDEKISVSALIHDEANYIHAPEQRPYYAAYSEKLQPYKKDIEQFVKNNSLIVEAEALESGRVNHSIPIRIKRVLHGDIGGKKELYVCDHFNDDAGVFEKGKTYVMALQVGGSAHDEAGENIIGTDEENSFVYEYLLMDLVKTTQCTKDGTVVPSALNSGASWDEVTGDFYNTTQGKGWLNIGDAMYRAAYSFPVIPTNNTELVTPFYTDRAVINEGRDIFAEEYENGAKVCLVRREFAERNDLNVGDEIELPLYYADYEKSSAHYFKEESTGVQINFIDGLLNANGEPYDVFWNEEYTVVGTYELIGDGEGGLGNNAVIIPERSVEASDENNIVAVGPMMAYSTSFQIPNGTIDEYTELLDEQTLQKLEIQFYDNGYSDLKRGFDNLKMISLLLFAAGIAAVSLVLYFLLHEYIVKQKTRIAIERTLGMSVRESTGSLLMGLSVIMIAAVLVGTILGFEIMGKAAQEAVRFEQYFDTAYSIWENSVDLNREAVLDLSIINIGTGAIYFFVLSIIMGVLSLIRIKNVAKQPPMVLLSDKYE